MVRIGFCMPKDMTSFDIYSNYPEVIRRNNYTKARSLRELDAINGKTAIYHDTRNGWVPKVHSPSQPPGRHLAACLNFNLACILLMSNFLK